MIVTRTDFDPPSLQSKTMPPQTQTFHAAWNWPDFFIQESPPDGTNRINIVTGLLVGQSGKTRWHIINQQITTIQRSSTNAFDPNTDNNAENNVVDVGRGIIRSILAGGLELCDIKLDKNHLTAKLNEENGDTINADFEFDKQPKQLVGKTAGGLKFRVEYSDWFNAGSSSYPHGYTLFVKYPGENEFKELYKVNIISLTLPYTGSNNIFTPAFHVNLINFKSYAYISNKVFFLAVSGPVKVAEITPPPPVKNSNQKTYIMLVLLIILLPPPLALCWAKFVKTNKTQNNNKNEP